MPLIAQLELFGETGPRQHPFVQTSTIPFADTLREALVSKADCICLEIDSRGGLWFGSLELSDEIFNARGKKPIHAVVRGHAEGVSYLIASAADKVVATPGSWIGGIGAAALHREFSEAAKTDGIRFTLIKSGRFKGAGNPTEPLSHDARQMLQEGVDATAGEFIRAVARNRALSPQRVAADFGEGGVFLANEARRRGMVDDVMSFESAMLDLASR